jgi:hypothetical protein
MVPQGASISSLQTCIADSNVDAPATGDPLSGELSSLPYALHNAYGAAALPVLENALKKSGYVWVRTNCARELIIENRPSGFAFVADAIEQDRFYKREMIEFLRGRFPELRGEDDAAVLAFLKRRAVWFRFCFDFRLSVQR